MPLYDYTCTHCAKTMEVLLSIKEAEGFVKCPICGVSMARQVCAHAMVGRGRPEMVEQPSAHTPTWKRERFRKETEAQNRQAAKDFRKMQKQLAQGKNPSANV